MSCRIVVCGAAGRMGTRILDLARRDSRLSIAGAVESLRHPAVGRTILDGTVQVSNDLQEFEGRADAVVDFTVPEATLGHLRFLLGWKKKPGFVIGTTGFSPAQRKVLESASRRIPIVISPNMSRGVNLLLEVARQVARRLPDYDVEIIETHHNQKKDAPSGTALALAREIADELKRTERDYVYGRRGAPGARTRREIGIHAVRAGDVAGDHTVVFASQGERIELVHRASSRDAFASGALFAALWLRGKKPGLYSMKEVLKA